MDSTVRQTSSLASSCALLPVWYQFSAILAVSLLFLFTNESEVIQWVASQFHVDFGTSVLWATGTSTDSTKNSFAKSSLLGASKDWKNYHNFMEVMSLRERLALVAYSALLVLLVYLISPLRYPASSRHLWLVPTWLVDVSDKRLQRKGFSSVLPVLSAASTATAVDPNSSSDDEDDGDDEDRERTASRHKRFSMYVLGVVLLESVVLLRSWIVQATLTDSYRDVALVEGALLRNVTQSSADSEAHPLSTHSAAAFLASVLHSLDFQQRLNPKEWLSSMGTMNEWIPYLQSAVGCLDGNIHFLVQQEVFRQMMQWWVLHVLPASIFAFFHRLLLDTRHGGAVVSFRWCLLTYGFYRIVVEVLSVLFLSSAWPATASSFPQSLTQWIDYAWSSKILLVVWCTMLLAYANFLYGPKKRQGMIAVPSVKLRFVLMWTMIARCAVAPIIVFLVVVTISLSVHIVELALLWLVLLLLLLWVPASIDTFSTDFFLLFGGLIVVSLSDTPLSSAVSTSASFVKLVTCFVVVVGTFATVSLVFNGIRTACKSRLIATITLLVVGGVEVIIARYLLLVLQIEHVQWLFSFSPAASELARNQESYVLWGIWIVLCVVHSVLTVACYTVLSSSPSTSFPVTGEADEEIGTIVDIPLTVDVLIKRWIASLILAGSTVLSIAAALLFYEFVMKQLAIPVDVGRMMSLFVACAVFGAATESADSQLVVVCRILGLMDPPNAQDGDD